MNSIIFTKLLEAEALNLYHGDSTPEDFMLKVKPLIEELLKEKTKSSMSEIDLEEILVSSSREEKQNSANRNCFFDVVDLSMYRAN
ncbi:MAG: hypothetical protein WCI31_03520 [Prolixibacteraceae bacterium]